MQTYRQRSSSSRTAEHSVPGQSVTNAPNSALVSQMTELPSSRVDLSGAMNKRLESRFGIKLDGLKVFADEGLSELGHAAYSRGNEIHYDDNLDTASPFGSEVLMHETGHVVQQGSGLISGSGYHANPSLERQASDNTFAAPENFSMPASAGGPVQGWGFANLMGRKDRGHDLLMPEGARKVNESLAPGSEKYTANDMENLNIGNYNNDMGPFYREANVKARENGAFRPGFMKQAVFALDFKLGGKGGSKNRFNPIGHRTDFVQNAHVGKLQFMHGMKSTNNKDSLDTTRKMKLYAALGYGIGANGAVKSGNQNPDGTDKMLTLDSHISDLGNSRFAELGFQNISDLYENGSDMNKNLKKASDSEYAIDKYRGKLESGGLSDRQKKKYTNKLTCAEEKLAHTNNKLDYMRAMANGETPGQNAVAPKKMRDLDAKIEKYKGKSANASFGFTKKRYEKKLTELQAARNAEIESYKGRTIRQLIGISDSDTASQEEKDRAAKMRLLGSVSHMAQDSYANSHAFRGEVSFEGRGDINAIAPDNFDAMMAITPGILQNADFTKQDENKHHHADVLAYEDETHVDKGKTKDQINSPARINATAGAAQARLMTSHILYGASKGADGNSKISNDEMETHFDRMFSLDTNVERGLKLKRNLENIHKGIDPTEQIDGDILDEDVIHASFSVPGSGRGYTKGELGDLYTGGDQSVRDELQNYSSLLKVHEHGEGMAFSPNRIKSGNERMEELLAKYKSLKAASQYAEAEGGGNGELADQIHNHIFELYKHMETVGDMTNDSHKLTLDDARAFLFEAAKKKWNEM